MALAFLVLPREQIVLLLPVLLAALYFPESVGLGRTNGARLSGWVNE